MVSVPILSTGNVVCDIQFTSVYRGRASIPITIYSGMFMGVSALTVAFVNLIAIAMIML